jgi:hypothetical protein
VCHYASLSGQMRISGVWRPSVLNSSSARNVRILAGSSRSGSTKAIRGSCEKWQISSEKWQTVGERIGFEDRLVPLPRVNVRNH